MQDRSRRWSQRVVRVSLNVSVDFRLFPGNLRQDAMDSRTGIHVTAVVDFARVGERADCII